MAEWYFSDDEEHFQGDGDATREDALEEARESYGMHGTVWTGRKVPPTVPRINVAWVLEALREKADDDDWEAAESWLEKVTPEQEAELQAALDGAFRAWLVKHKHEPTWFDIADVQEHAAKEGEDPQ